MAKSCSQPGYCNRPFRHIADDAANYRVIERYPINTDAANQLVTLHSNAHGILLTYLELNRAKPL